MQDTCNKTNNENNAEVCQKRNENENLNNIKIIRCNTCNSPLIPFNNKWIHPPSKHCEESDGFLMVCVDGELNTLWEQKYSVPTWDIVDLVNGIDKITKQLDELKREKKEMSEMTVWDKLRWCVK